MKTINLNTYYYKKSEIDDLLSRKANLTHMHGNITNDGFINNQASKNVVTDANGKITTEAKPTIPAANTTATNIKMNGTQSAGSLDSFAKADHVHPVDTSRAAASHTHSNYLTSHQDISGKENISNKTTTISSSSTDTQYPSAKAVYTGLSGKANSSHTHSNYLTSHQDISGKENISNKTTTISSSSTDTQYPSAKATYTELNKKANSSHTHDDRYYTETEINTKLNDYLTTSSATSSYQPKGNYVTTSAIKNDLTTGGASNVLSAEQGKTLKGLVDGKANSSHTHGSISNTGTLNSDTTTVSKVVVTDGSNNIKTISKIPSANVTHQDISGKAPNNHASTTNTYGLGSTSNYGHVKTINALTQNSHSDGTALSAYQGYLLNDKINKIVSGETATDHNHDGRYYTETEIDTKLNGKAASSHTHVLNDITVAELPENINYNDYKTPGLYRAWWANQQNYTNRPTTSGGLLKVEYIPNGYAQTFYVYGVNSNQIFYRTYYVSSDVWNSWIRIDGQDKANTTHTHPDTQLNWNGTALAGSVSPIDMAMYEEFSANRLAYLPGNNITIEYSTNGGSTWTDYGATAEQKLALVTTGQSFVAGKGATASANNQLRITINAGGGNNVQSNVYVATRKLMIYYSTAGGTNTKVKIETSTYGSPTTWSTIGTYNIAGYSGWNSYPLAITYGGMASQTNGTRIQNIRLTFTTGSANNFSVQKIRLFGENCWIKSSTLADTGHIYTYDNGQNVTFPGHVYTNGKFIKNGGTNTQLLLANGDTKATTDFATSGHTHSNYANSSHNHASSNITEASALSHLGTSANATQATVNSAINTKIGTINTDISTLKSIKAIEVVASKPTASASTMNKLYIVSESGKVNVYYTSQSGSTYSWHKMDTDILDELSIAWNDITGKPSSFTPSSHTHGAIQNGGTLNSDTTTVSKAVVTDGSNNIKTISKIPFANLNITKNNITGLGIPASDTNTTYSADESTLTKSSANQFSIKSGGVTSSHIADKTIVNGDIADATIETGKIKDSAITSAKIASGTIVNDDIANTTITGGKLVNGTVTATQLASNSVETAKIKDGAVTNSKLSGTKITASSSSIVDLNDDTYQKTGLYYCEQDSYAPYIIHCPLSNGTATPYSENKGFFLFVEDWGTNAFSCKQTFTYYHNNTTYIRTKKSNTWSGWQRTDGGNKADKTGGVAQVTDINANKYTNIGSLSSGATQQAINNAINTALGGKQASGSYAAANHTHNYSPVGHSHQSSEVLAPTSTVSNLLPSNLPTNVESISQEIVNSNINAKFDDSGLVNFPYNSNAQDYSSDEGLKIRKIGNIVTLGGIAKTKASISANGDLQIGTLSQEYYPPMTQYSMTMFPTDKIGFIKVKTDGKVYACLRSGSSATVGSGVYFPVNITWMVD